MAALRKNSAVLKDFDDFAEWAMGNFAFRTRGATLFAEWAILIDFLRRMGDDASRMGDVARRMGDGFRRMGDVSTEWATAHSAFPSPNGRRFDFFLKFSVWPRRDCSHGLFSVAEWAMIGSAGKE